MNLRARVYGLLVRMHPEAFREEFGLEMRLDFEEAAKSQGVAGLYWDAVISVGRQWVQGGVAGEREGVPVAARFLLDGRYGAIGDYWISPFEFGRGTVLAVVLFGGLVSVQGHSPRAVDLMKGGDAASAGTRGAAAKQASEVGPAPVTQAASGRRPDMSGMRAAPAAQAVVRAQEHEVRAAFVPPMRIGEMVAGQATERLEAQRRLDVIFRGEASVGEPGGRYVSVPLANVGRVGVLRRAQVEAASEASPRFDVVSIREDKAPPAHISIHPQLGPTPNGYRMEHLPMLFALREAYIPALGDDSVQFSMKQIEGLPEWVKYSSYVIDAKVSEADLTDWQVPALQPEMMRSRLHAMFSERLGLVVHRGTREASVFEMTVGKGGPKFKPAEADTLEEIRKKHPEARVSGGTIGAPGAAQGEFTFFNVTMPGFAASMSNMAGRQIEDKTGLSGRYDITYRMPPPPEPGAAVGVGTDSDNTVSILDIMGQLGLKLQAAKGQVETLVIDHVEKPTDN